MHIYIIPSNYSYHISFQVSHLFNMSTISGNQYWFGLRKPPCQFLFGVCPCLQLFGNISYSLYSNHNHNNSSNLQTDSGSTASNFNTPPSAEDEVDDGMSSHGESNSTRQVRNSETGISVVGSDSSCYLPSLGSSNKKKSKKMDHIVVPALTLEMPD